MSSTFQLRPEETILFQGDVVSPLSLLKANLRHGVVTNQRCVFLWNGPAFRGSDGSLDSGKLVERHHRSSRF